MSCVRETLEYISSLLWSPFSEHLIDNNGPLGPVFLGTALATTESRARLLTKEHSRILDEAMPCFAIIGIDDEPLGAAHT